MRTGTKNNKGFSLIELIVVIAIIAVLLGGVTLSASYLTGQRARECANNLSFALDNTRTSAIAKNANAECYMELTLEGGDYYASYYVPKNALSNGTITDSAGNTVINHDAYVLSEKERIGSSSPKITFSGALGDVTVDSQTAVRIFYKKNGAFSRFVEVTAAGESESESEISSVSKITIEYGKTYELEVYMLTGKHVMNVV